MKHKILSGHQFTPRSDARISIFKYIRNYHDIKLSGFNRIIMYDI